MGASWYGKNGGRTLHAASSAGRTVASGSATARQPEVARGELRSAERPRSHDLHSLCGCRDRGYRVGNHGRKVADVDRREGRLDPRHRHDQQASEPLEEPDQLAVVAEEDARREHGRREIRVEHEPFAAGLRPRVRRSAGLGHAERADVDETAHPGVTTRADDVRDAANVNVAIPALVTRRQQR